MERLGHTVSLLLWICFWMACTWGVIMLIAAGLAL